MILAETTKENGEAARAHAILREGPAGYEIIVDGQFLISSASGHSSEILVRNGLDRLKKHAGKSGEFRVLIAGLGLGFSLNTAIECLSVAEVTVVELESAVILWHRQGLIPLCADSLRDPRTRQLQFPGFRPSSGGTL